MYFVEYYFVHLIGIFNFLEISVLIKYVNLNLNIDNKTNNNNVNLSSK